MAAALLHDTATLPTELVSVFNEDTANLVAEVTDDKSLEKGNTEETANRTCPSKFQTSLIKLADKISNLRSLVKSPHLQRRQECLDWALEVAKGLRGTNVWLETHFDEAADDLAASFAESACQLVLGPLLD